MPVTFHDEIAPLLGQLIARTPDGEVLFSGLSRQQRRDGWWKRAVTKAGCPHIRFVDLRSYAVNWMRPAIGDVDPKTAAATRRQTWRRISMFGRTQMLKDGFQRKLSRVAQYVVQQRKKGRFEYLAVRRDVTPQHPLVHVEAQTIPR